MSRSKNLEVDEEEFQRVKRLIIGKAKRYSLAKVEISDRLIVGFSPEQVERLVAEVAEADHELVFKDHIGYSAVIASRRQEKVSRFGGEPKRSQGVRHPKSVDWANEGLRGSRS